jgi:uncharacterized protein
MSKHVILEVVVGSTVHGVSVNDGLEDLDLLAVAVEDMPGAVGFGPTDTWVERTKPTGVRSEAGDVDRTVYGLRKFLSLALKGNPTILLAFFVPTPFVKHRDIFGHTLQSLYPRIVSKQAFNPFRGYMRQQHERLLGLRGQRNVTRPELVDAFGYDTKYAAHIVRLGLQGEELLSTGRMTLPMPEDQRELVRSIRQGKYTLAEVSEKIIEAESRILRANETSPLREKPDHAFVEDWMLRVYRHFWLPPPPEQRAAEQHQQHDADAGEQERGL